MKCVVRTLDRDSHEIIDTKEYYHHPRSALKHHALGAKAGKVQFSDAGWILLPKEMPVVFSSGGLSQISARCTGIIAVQSVDSGPVAVRFWVENLAYEIRYSKD